MIQFTFKSFFILTVIFTFNSSNINGQSINLPENQKTNNFVFIENNGQILDQDGVANNKVKYLLNTPGLNVQLRNFGFSYDVYTKDKAKSNHSLNGRQFYSDTTFFTESNYKFHRVDIDFLNVNPFVTILAKDEDSNKYNYFNEADNEGIIGVQGYKRIIYENLYKNIDLEFFIPVNQNKPVEYNFVIHPNADLSDIKMKVSGANVINRQTYLELDMSLGIMMETIPSSWIENNQSKREVIIEYSSLGDKTFGFKSSDTGISSKSKLTIDPTPVRLWATYFGGEDDDTQYDADVETDSNGNVFTSGYTRSATNIATAGSFQTVYGSSWNGYLTKFNSDGVLLWATYYGSYRTSFRSISIDENDNIIGVGDTYSTNNMSTTGSHQPALYDNGTENYFDGFIVKFDTNGNRLWGTYYGGESFDYCTSVSTDSNNNILVGGHTASNENIASSGAFLENVNLDVHSNWGTFLVKLNENGQRQWATYYGGQYSTGVDVDSNGSAFLLGIALNRDEDISTPGAYQEEYSDEAEFSWSDSFLVKFDMNGNREWGTYYGGDSYDDSYGVVVDYLDNVIICGATRSNIFPTTPGAHQPTKGGAYYDYDAFLAKFSSNGDIVWNTLYGGQEIDEGYNVDVDSNNNVFLVGYSWSQNAIATPDTFQESSDGSPDAFLAKFNPLGTRLWGTYYGGSSSDGGLDIEIDALGDLYLLGYTFGSTNLATPGSHQENYNAEIDNFLVKFKDCLSSIITDATTNLCEGESIELNASGGISYLWTGPNGFTSTDPNIIITNATSGLSGQYSVEVVSGSGCDDTRTFDILVSTTPSILPLPNINACANIGNEGYSSSFDTSGLQDTVIDGQTGVIVTYFDENGNELTSPLPNPMSNTVQGLETITVRISNEGNPLCFAETTFNLIVDSLPIISSVGPFYVCDDDTDGFAIFDLSQVTTDITNNQANLDVSFYNELGDLIPTPLLNYSNSIEDQETINVVVTNTITSCQSEINFDIIVNPLPIANTLTPLIGCDDDGDGISNSFDTSFVIDEVLNGQTGMQVLFFNSTGSQIGSLSNPYTNITAFEEIITVRVVNSATTCYAETELTLTTVDLPIVSQPFDIYACDEGNGFSTFDTSTIEAQLIGTQTGLQLIYSDDNGNVLPSPLPVSFQNTTTYQQTISVRAEVIANTQCFVETNFNLVVNELPEILLEDAYLICALEVSETVTLPLGYDYYEWRYEDGSIISSINEAVITEEGSYTVTVGETTNGIYCSDFFSFQLIRSDLPTILSVNYADLGNNFIEIIAVGDGDFEYSINGIDYQDSNVFNNISGGIYTAYVRDKNNCGEDSQEVILVDFPLYFTPNVDGFHDVWHIEGVSAFQNAKIFIYDRYGKLLKQLNPNSLGWDGTFKGEPMPSSDYWFTVDLGNNRSFKSHFTLKR